jgi:LDH2 family malate/lactate/ureidoglycolate dehydrogenase
LPYKALIKPDGEWTDDPLTFFESPGSSIAPLGGEQLGYKGYGLTLFSEIWSMALSQYGRRQGSDDGDANSIWVQVIDPEAFGEKQKFLQQVDDLLADSRKSAPAVPEQPVRIPGEAAQKCKREQLQQGVSYSSATLKVLQRCAEFCGVDLPKAVNG